MNVYIVHSRLHFPTTLKDTRIGHPYPQMTHGKCNSQHEKGP
jgi:hypothetical protein